MANALNPYGVTIGLNPGSGNPASNYAYWSNLFGDVATLGLTTLRFQLSWDSIQLHQSDLPSAWSWGPLDDAVSHCNAQGINIVFPLRGAPSWTLNQASQQATTEPWYLPNSNGTSDTNSFAYFAQQVATRYNGNNGHGHLDGIEVGNEEFNIHHTSPTGGFSGIHNSTYSGLYGSGGAITTSNKVEPSRDAFFASPVLKACYPVIKAAYPGVKVGMMAMWWMQPVNIGGIPNTNISNFKAFMQQLYADSCKGNFDYVNLHYYSNATDPSVGDNQTITVAQALTDVGAVLTANSDTIKVRMTECGWQVPTDTDANTQASRYSYLLTQAKSSGIVEQVDFFTLDYKITGMSQSSLVQWNGSTYAKQPAYTTLQNFIAQYPQWFVPTALATTSRRSGSGIAISRRLPATITTQRRG